MYINKTTIWIMKLRVKKAIWIVIWKVNSNWRNKVKFKRKLMRLIRPLINAKLILVSSIITCSGCQASK
jgi:hypothetical protein